MKNLLAYLQLFRIPNVFTAMADITAGFVFVRGGLTTVPTFICLLAASSLLYIAGVVLNDVFDVEQDRKERSDRPIPSGRIKRSTAMGIGFAMLVAGVALAWIVGLLPLEKRPDAFIRWRGGVIAILLAACIVAYDAVIKRTAAGPIFMGACRFFNILLGMSVASLAALDGPAWLLHYEPGQLLVAGGVGVYIAGVTWFARTEAAESNRGQLVGGLLLMIAGLAMLTAYSLLPKTMFQHFQAIAPWKWQLLILLVGFTIVRSAAMAVFDPRPQRVQNAVKTAILSLIVIDAAIAVVVSPVYGVAILALLAPTLLLGRWIYST